MDRREDHRINDESSDSLEDPHAWKRVVARFQRPAALRANWQIVNTLTPYAALWLLMYLTLGVSIWLTLGLAILAAGFLVRVFIIFHDCTHGSFFASKHANSWVGFVAGVLTFTPFAHWRWEHARHHATSGDLDRRGVGDVGTMTVDEYVKASTWERVRYRMTRNPITLFVFAPLFLFLIKQRFSSSGAGQPERRSVLWTNVCLVALAVVLSWLFGWQAYVFIQLVILAVSGAAGVWLFYVQHQFEDVYWERGDEWSFVDAALKGSSFYRLPKALQWLSGNIGYHHVHHLSARVPNYRLEACHRSDPLFRSVKPVTLRSSLGALRLRLWDEEARRLVGFRDVRKNRRA
ncbi:fatty acid desaturase [Pelagicoccus sp. SDUM812003]|uniref:fatty acid desaturase n=1 Tax=Pelagicoccus sp. SDUM812003 TaxID=3041267 RepID=UPI00280D92C9|nr:fatty acid desaturase [Pelagicoccus sp. SDUM812003]MDQ8204715.1 fatty acid desaturase [Pelagicoccus sp. SDUM812003]